MLAAVTAVLAAGVWAFLTATAEQRDTSNVVEPTPGEGFERYGQVEYVPIAQDNAQTLILLFGGIGLVAAVVIVAAVMSRRRGREDD